MSYAINSTNTGWRAINSISDLLPGETYSETQPILPPITIPLSQQAQIELDRVTGQRGTIIRCAAAGIQTPSNWVTYVQQLRAIANGNDTISTVLPIQPAYPAGT